MISCLVPVHNGERFLALALESILSQDCPEREIVVVDDGSTDGTPDVLARYPQVRVVRHDRPQGAPASRNRAAREARGELLAFLDCDDLWPPDRLGWMAACLAGQPELEAVLGETQHFLDPAWTGGPLPERLASPVVAYLSSALMVRRASFERVGAYRPEHQHGSDADFFLRARAQGFKLHLDRRLALRRRLHGQNMSLVGTQDAREDFLRVIKRRLDAGRVPPETAFQAMARAFDQLETPRQHFFQTPAGRVRVRHQGAELELEALVPTPAGPADLTLDLWDEAPTGLACPPQAAAFPNAAGALRSRGALTSGPGRWFGWRGIGQNGWLDRAGSRLVVARREWPAGERSKPFLLPLSVWHADRGVELLFASAVARQGRGLLLCGDENSGKTTALLRLVQAGWDFVADDITALHPEGWTARPLFRSAWLAPEPAGWLGLEPHTDPRWEKGWLPVPQAGPEAHLQGLLFLRLGTAHRLRPLAPAEAFRRLVLLAFYRTVARQNQARLDMLARLAGELPAQELEIGPDLGALPDLLAC